jgi:hypothetical protein
MSRFYSARRAGATLSPREVVLAFLVTLASACAGGQDSAREDAGTPRSAGTADRAATVVRASQFGDNWPLTIDSAEVDCIEPSTAVARFGGRVFALNGMAMQRGFADIDPYWRADPKIPGARVNIGLLIDSALAHCRKI